MTLSFKTEIDGKLTHFVEKILSGWPEKVSRDDDIKYWQNKKEDQSLTQLRILCRLPKIHTIRKDEKNRWEAGNKIHFVINNRTPQRFQFAPVLTVKSVQQLELRYINGRYGNIEDIVILIDGGRLGRRKWLEFAQNDGFDTVEDFLAYFSEDFTGKIIHWTDKKY